MGVAPSRCGNQVTDPIEINRKVAAKLLQDGDPDLRFAG
jgi:hypothetical protein